MMAAHAQALRLALCAAVDRERALRRELTDLVLAAMIACDPADLRAKAMEIARRFHLIPAEVLEPEPVGGYEELALGDLNDSEDDIPIHEVLE